MARPATASYPFLGMAPPQKPCPNPLSVLLFTISLHFATYERLGSRWNILVSGDMSDGSCIRYSTQNAPQNGSEIEDTLVDAMPAFRELLRLVFALHLHPICI